MLYLDINKPTELVVTLTENITVYTITQSVYSGPAPIGDLLHCTITAWQGSTQQFLYQTNASVTSTDGHSPTDVATMTPDGYMICLNPGVCFVNISGSFCGQYTMTVNANPSGIGVETIVLPTYFTWRITDADTNKQYIFTNDDISPAPWYYNMFTFSVVPGATYGLTAGIITAQQGVYTYEVYQTKNQYDLTTNGILLETGILNIEGTYSVVKTFTQSAGNIITFKNI